MAGVPMGAQGGTGRGNWSIALTAGRTEERSRRRLAPYLRIHERFRDRPCARYRSGSVRNRPARSPRPLPSHPVRSSVSSAVPAGDRRCGAGRAAAGQPGQDEPDPTDRAARRARPTAERTAARPRAGHQPASPFPRGLGGRIPPIPGPRSGRTDPGARKTGCKTLAARDIRWRRVSPWRRYDV